MWVPVLHAKIILAEESIYSVIYIFSRLLYLARIS